MEYLLKVKFKKFELNPVKKNKNFANNYVNLHYNNL